MRTTNQHQTALTTTQLAGLTDTSTRTNPSAAQKLETPLGPTSGRPQTQATQPRGPLGHALGQVMRGVRNVAAATAMAGLVFGLAGCKPEAPVDPLPYEPVEVHMSAGENGVALGHTGETRVAADLRIALHKLANAEHGGSRSQIFLHYAGEDGKLSTMELASMMEAAGVGNSDVGRLLGAKAAFAFRDATGDGQLGWGEFKQIIYAPSELAEGK